MAKLLALGVGLLALGADARMLQSSSGATSSAPAVGGEPGLAPEAAQRAPLGVRLSARFFSTAHTHARARPRGCRWSRV